MYEQGSEGDGGVCPRFFVLLLIVCGLYYVAFDFHHYAGVVYGVGGDGDGFGESAYAVGVVAHADFTGFAGHDGFLGPFGRGAAAAGADAAEDEGFVAGVGEGEGAVAVAAFLYGAVVVLSFGKDNLGAVLFGLGCLLFFLLCVHSAYRHEGDEAC